LSAYLTATKLRTVRIVGVKDETPTIKSITFNDKRTANNAKPGQFVMVWIPDFDEIPMSLSTINPKEDLAAISVERVGEATDKLHKMKINDIIGVRGPFGNGYSVTKTHNVMIVGGGTGLASLAPLTERIATQTKHRVTLLHGAQTCNELLFLERMKTALSKNGKLIVTTEDGSYGEKGVVTEPLERLLTTEKFDMVYACGPENMMLKVFHLTEHCKVSLQVSLERLMRCAIGLCGTCVIGRFRVCRDGPVFSGDQLREVKNEFGHFRRGFDGRKMVL
jgi:dihydroorotate dehydrogenase electron transfer subunit